MATSTAVERSSVTLTVFAWTRSIPSRSSRSKRGSARASGPRSSPPRPGHGFRPRGRRCDRSRLPRHGFPPSTASPPRARSSLTGTARRRRRRPRRLHHRPVADPCRGGRSRTRDALGRATALFPVPRRPRQGEGARGRRPGLGRDAGPEGCRAGLATPHRPDACAAPRHRGGAGRKITAVGDRRL